MTNEQTIERGQPVSLPDKVWATLDRISQRAEEDHQRAEERHQRAEEERKKAAEERKRADEEHQKADEERKKAAEERRKKADEKMDRLEASIRETSEQMKETDRRLKKAEELFTTQWGKLMESLVEGDLAPLLKERGIDVEGTAERSNKRRNGEHMEIDIVAVNGAEVVAVEVKTTLRPNHVKHFVRKLSRFFEWFPEYNGRRLHGAMAYLRSESKSAVHAERQGLFVIRATGSSASIVNAPDFKPRAFS